MSRNTNTSAQNVEFRGPLFVLGYGRSGTKLLRAILTGCRGVRIADIETNCLPLWSTLLPRYGDLSDRRNFDAFFRATASLPFFDYAAARGRPIDPVSWYLEAAPFDLASLFESLLKLHLGFDDAKDRLWGDKSPTYTAHTAFLHQLYPQARFVHIVRDGRDCCASARRAWGANVFRTAQRWNDTVQRPGIDLAGTAGVLLELRYEDLLADPETETRRVCEFLDLPYDASLWREVESGEAVGRARQQRGLLAANNGGYRDALSPATVSRINRIAGDALARHGYEPDAHSSERLGRLTATGYRVADGIRQVTRRVPAMGFVGALRFVVNFLRQNLASERLKRRR